MRLRALENAKKNYEGKLQDEERLGVPSGDESIVADYIRNRVETPEDIVSGIKIFKREAASKPESEYEKESKKLQALSPNEIRELLKAVEEKSKKNKESISRGNLLNGYAIDPKTLMSLQSEH